MRPYEPGLREDQVRERSGRERILKLSSNEAPLGPFPAALAAMQVAMHELNRYPEGGCETLRARIAEHLGQPAESIVVSSGSNELLRLIGQAVTRPGDEIVFAWPSFVVYPMVAQMFGAVPVQVPLTADHRHDLPAMAKAITPKTRSVYLCNPNNPTGTIYTRAEFDEFFAAVPEDVLLILDEAYFEFVTDPDYPDGLDYFDGKRRVAVCRTFSKMYSLAGLRVGYGLLPNDLALAVNKIREPFNVNTLAQVAAEASLDDQAEVTRRREENQEQKTYLYSCFDRLGVRYVPSHTNFVYLLTERPVEVFEALLEQGVIARGLGAAPALRLGVGTPEDTVDTCAAFEAVVERLGAI